MHRIPAIILSAAFACSLAATAAFAHAFLDHAVPGVGATVSGSPSELKLTFTQSLVPAFASVQIATAAGAPVSAGKATSDPADPATLHVRLGSAVKARSLQSDLACGLGRYPSHRRHVHFHRHALRTGALAGRRRGASFGRAAHAPDVIRWPRPLSSELRDP